MTQNNNKNPSTQKNNPSRETRGNSDFSLLVKLEMKTHGKKGLPKNIGQLFESAYRAILGHASREVVRQAICKIIEAVKK